MVDAVLNGSHRCIGTLLAAGADVNKITTNGITIFMCATGYGDATSVELLLGAGKRRREHNQHSSKHQIPFTVLF